MDINGSTCGRLANRNGSAVTPQIASVRRSRHDPASRRNLFQPACDVAGGFIDGPPEVVVAPLA